MSNDSFRLLLERGDVSGVRAALDSDPELANATIHWHLNRHNDSDPLHYVSDCVGHGWLTNGTDGEITQLLLAHGAKLNGAEGRESPLIAAVSLGAENAAKVLVDAGADLELTSIFGSRALHWAAWTGAPNAVQLLVSHGAKLEVKCSEFGATPLFWAVHGYGPDGPKEKAGQVEAARRLIEAGAKADTSNKHGQSAVELAATFQNKDMHELLRQHA